MRRSANTILCLVAELMATATARPQGGAQNFVMSQGCENVRVLP
jgi:hypothetical protein